VKKFLRKNIYGPINEEKFEINELEKIIDSQGNENELTIYSLLRLELNCHKAQKFY
jgi:hypothetical protein